MLWESDCDRHETNPRCQLLQAAGHNRIRLKAHVFLQNGAQTPGEHTQLADQKTDE